MASALKDCATRKTVKYIASSQKYHQTVLMVTHNEALAQSCDRIIRIEDGRLYQREDAFYGEGGEL